MGRAKTSVDVPASVGCHPNDANQDRTGRAVLRDEPGDMDSVWKQDGLVKLRTASKKAR
jgi:hypothetical protein